MDIYGTEGGLVYDPFMGVGTTANGALEFGMEYVGSELSEKQVEFSEEKLHRVILVEETEVETIISTELDPFWD